MDRPRLVPKYVNIEMTIVMDRSISSSAKETYMFLKALSWGEDTISFTITEFTHLFGVSRATIYRHLTLLSKASVLRYRSPASRTTGWVYVEFLARHSREGLGKSPPDSEEGPDPVSQMRPVSRLRAPYYINSSSSEEEFKTPQEEEEEDFNQLINNRLNKLNRGNREEFHNLGSKTETWNTINETGPLKNQRPGLKVEIGGLANQSPSLKNEMGRNEAGVGPKTADPTSGGVFRRYEQNIGPLTPMLADEIGEALKSYPEKWIEDAIQIAVEYNKRSWAYCRVILERWYSQGKDDGRRKDRLREPESFISYRL